MNMLKSTNVSQQDCKNIHLKTRKYNFGNICLNCYDIFTCQRNITKPTSPWFKFFLMRLNACGGFSPCAQRQ